MSIWCHVNASFRIDCLPAMTADEVVEMFGARVETDSDWNEYCDNPERFLPTGSEGSLNWFLWRNPRANELASTTVVVFGDLRDVEAPDIIESWLDRVVENVGEFFRQAIVQVEIEYIGNYLYRVVCENDKPVIRKTILQR